MEWWKPVLFEKIKKLAKHVDKKAAHVLPKFFGEEVQKKGFEGRSPTNY